MTKPILRILALTIATTASGLVLAGDPTAAQEASDAPVRTFQKTIDAEDLDRVDLLAGDGEIVLTASSSDSVSIELTVKENPEYRPRLFHTDLGEARFRRRASEHLEAVELTARREGETLRIGLTPTEKDLLIEHWKISVPERLAADLEIDSGTIHASGTAGGLDLVAREGRIDVDVPRGDLEIDLSVGEIVARTRTDSYSEVRLVSEVGDVDLWLADHKVLHDDRPGPGSRVGLDGDGADVVRVSVEVGDADLHID